MFLTLSSVPQFLFYISTKQNSEQSLFLFTSHILLYQSPLQCNSTVQSIN